MRTDVPEILVNAMREGRGIPFVQVHYARPKDTLGTEDGDQIGTETGDLLQAQDNFTTLLATEDGDTIGGEDGLELAVFYVGATKEQTALRYHMSRLKCSVTAIVVEGEEPTEYAAMFYLKRGLILASVEYTIDSPVFYLDTYTADANRNEITYSGQILPDLPLSVNSSGKTAAEVIEEALAQNNIPVYFNTDGDVWYSWLWDIAASFSATNSASLLSTIRKKYMALLLPRQNGMTFGHPESFVTDTWEDYPITMNVQEAQPITQPFKLWWTDESGVLHSYGDSSLPSHLMEYVPSTVPESEIAQLQNVHVGGDIYTQRPDFRIEHGDRITQSDSRYKGIYCLEWIEDYEPNAPLPWKQTLKPINYNANVTYRPFLAAGDVVNPPA